MSTYLVSIGDKEYEVSINPDGVVTVPASGEQIDVRPISKDTYSVLIGENSVQITANNDGGEFQILLQHNQVDARVETHRDSLLKKYASSSVKAHSRYEIHAPMPALVVKIEVSVGDEVKEGQGLLILEAMKMENEIRSPQAGKVREVLAIKGRAVEKGELLLLLE
jgi:biotin carboxyl carrier protein